MKLPKLSMDAFRRAAAHPIVMGIAAGVWLSVAFHEPDKILTIVAAFTAGICAAAILYHTTIRRLIRVNDKMCEAMEAQQEIAQALMAIKAGEISQGIADQLRGVTSVEAPITRH